MSDPTPSTTTTATAFATSTRSTRSSISNTSTSSPSASSSSYSDTEDGGRFKVSKCRLFTAVICANLNSFSMGTSLSWTSPMLPRLHEPHDDSPLDDKVDTLQMGWILSLIAIGAGIAGYIAGRLQDHFGRRLALLMAATMFALAYILLAFSFRVEVVYAGRFSQGVGSGFTMAILPIYVGEVSTKYYRASAGSFLPLFMTIGSLSVIVFGRFFDYSTVQLICLCFPLAFFTLHGLVPESPYYLLMWDQDDEALDSLRQLCGYDCRYIDEELERIRNIVIHVKSRSIRHWTDILVIKSTRKAIIIVVGLMFFQQFSGVYVLMMNGQWIFAQADFFLKPSTCTIIVGSAQVVFSVSLEVFADLYGRRTLLKISATFMSLAHLAIGLYFYALTNGHSENWSTIVQWVPLMAFIMFQFFFRIGFGALPFVMCGEMFPLYVKSWAMSLVTLTWWSSGFIVTCNYPHLSEIRLYLPFLIHSAFCVLAYVFVDQVVIETFHLTLREIQEKLEGDEV